jgi:hypothetical protein
MVIKILGGKKASIRYQLKNPTARILHGDPAVTQRLIDGSHFSQKYCGIVLSFEENIAAETESAILDNFRHLLRGGLEEDALDVLAVGHADKIHPTTKAMRPDYHITAVETDLRTGRHVTIYHHRRDHDLFYAWERMINIKYGLSRPDDPARRRTIQIAKKLGPSRKELLATVDAAVCGEVKAGRIQDRADVIRFLEQAGFSVPRQGDNYLTIADKDGNRTRLKGLFYERSFDHQRLETGTAGTGTGSPDELREAENRVAKLFARRVAAFQKLYRRNRVAMPEVHAVGRDGDGLDDASGVSLDAGGDMENGARGITPSAIADRNGAEPGQAGAVAGGPIHPQGPAVQSPRQNLYRTRRTRVTHEKQRTGIDPIIIAHLGSLGARSRTAAAATTAIIRAATAAVGTKAGDLDRAGAGLAAAVADVVGVIAAVDRAVGFCRCPLQFLAQILIHEIRQRRISQRPVRPQLPRHKLPLPSLS